VLENGLNSPEATTSDHRRLLGFARPNRNVYRGVWNGRTGPVAGAGNHAREYNCPEKGRTT
jgi:hypothetical protein